MDIVISYDGTEYILEVYEDQDRKLFEHGFKNARDAFAACEIYQLITQTIEENKTNDTKSTSSQSTDLCPYRRNIRHHGL